MVILEEVILEEVILEAVPMMADLLMTMAALVTMQDPLMMVMEAEVILEEVILEVVPMMADLRMTMVALAMMQEPLTTMEVVMTQDRVMMMEVLLKEMCLQVSCRCWRRRRTTWLKNWIPESFPK